MKTIGILGGFSPQATLDFETRIHQVSQRLIPQHMNGGYPPMIVYYHRRPPVLTKDGFMPVLPLQPDPALLEAASWIGTKADFLVVTANGLHLFQDQFEQAAGRQVLSMITVTLEEVTRRGWKRVGLLGFPDPSAMVYAQPLNQLGIACELIDAQLQAQLNADVLALMEGRATGTAAQDAVEALRQKAVDGIILGCTEIPLLLGTDQADCLNPGALLAEAAVKFALDHKLVMT